MGSVLIIDDSPTVRCALSKLLDTHGHWALMAATAEEGLELLAQHRPDLIILDVVLPGYSGFELCRALKATPNTRDIPIVLHSYRNTAMNEFWGIKQGAYTFLPKPIDTTEFLRVVNACLASASV